MRYLYLLLIIIAMALYFFALKPSYLVAIKITEYKLSNLTQNQNKNDDDDCKIPMCSAFGGGIVGDTLALDFMSGE